MSSPMALRALLLTPALLALVACSKEPTPADNPAETAVLPTPVPPQSAPQPEIQAPEIIVDHTNVSVDKDHVPVAEPGLADRVFALVSGRPRVEGSTAQFVVMRNAKPAHVGAVLDALRRAKATGATAKSEARDGTTEQIALSFASAVADCATTAWIAKDGAIEVWPAGGGLARRVIRGLAGPDMTLGLAAVRDRWEGCGAPELVVGADEPIPWGVVFDLAESALSVPGTRVSAAIVVTRAVPGRKVVLP